jgi:hypothetical protein
MDPHQFLSKQWVVSPGARRVYRVAAAVSLTLYLSLILIVWYGPSPFLKQALFIGVLATAITGAGMEYFLFRFDDSKAWKQILWFLGMICAPLGPALFCFLVYSRSQALRNACAPSMNGALDNSKHLG